MSETLDICIRGAGMVGQTLALLLARERLRVGLVAGPAPSAHADGAGGADLRAYALNARSRQLLESLRCWPDALHATEVRAMQVKGDAGGEVNFGAEQLQVAGLTWIVDVPVLEEQLAQAIRFQPQITLLEAPGVQHSASSARGASAAPAASWVLTSTARPMPSRRLLRA